MLSINEYDCPKRIFAVTNIDVITLIHGHRAEELNWQGKIVIKIDFCPKRQTWIGIPPMNSILLRVPARMHGQARPSNAQLSQFRLLRHSGHLFSLPGCSILLLLLQKCPPIHHPSGVLSTKHTVTLVYLRPARALVLSQGTFVNGEHVTHH
jgi:hypothetical protein